MKWQHFDIWRKWSQGCTLIMWGWIQSLICKKFIKFCVSILKNMVLKVWEKLVNFGWKSLWKPQVTWIVLLVFTPCTLQFCPLNLDSMVDWFLTFERLVSCEGHIWLKYRSSNQKRQPAPLLMLHVTSCLKRTRKKVQLNELGRQTFVQWMNNAKL